MSEKYGAFGTQLQVGDSDDTGTAAFTTIAGLDEISEMGGETQMIPVGAHDDESAVIPKRPGRIDMGALTMAGYFDPAEATHLGASSLEALAKNRTRRAFKVIDVDTGATEAVFVGYISTFKTGPRNEDGDLRFNAAITLTSAITYS